MPLGKAMAFFGGLPAAGPGGPQAPEAAGAIMQSWVQKGKKQVPYDHEVLLADACSVVL